MEKDRMITTLGQTNKKFLREKYGYANIKQAYKDFGVNNAKDAYEALAFSWNFVLNLERKKKKEEENKMYVTTFIFEIRYIDKEYPTKVQIRQLNGSVVSKKKDINKAVNFWIENARKKYTDSDLELVSDIILSRTSIPMGNPVGLENIPMKDAFAYDLSGENKQEWDTKTGKCVFDYMIHLYGNVKGFKKIMNYKSLEEEFGEGTLENGVTINQINNFCKNFGLSYYALDSFENTIKYNVTKNTISAPSLIFRIINGHMYPVEEVYKRKSIAMRHREVNIRCKDVETKSTEKEATNMELIYPTNDELVGNKFAIDYINKCNKIPYPLTSKNLYYEDGNITQMIIDNKMILTYPIDERIKIYYGDKFQGQCLNSIVNELWTEVYNNKITECEMMSEYNNELYNILSREGIKHRVHLGSTREIVFEELNNAIACDIEKCYSSLILNPMDNFMVYDLLDEAEDFTNEYYYTDDSELPFGLYYVTTADLTILHQSNIYSNKILDYAKKHGIEFKIEVQMLCSNNNDNKTYFHPMINNTISKVKNLNIQKKDKFIKEILNSIVGCLGKTHSKNLQVGLNSNLKEVWENEVMRNVDKKDIYFNKLDDKLFVYGETIKKELYSNGLPIYIQILDWSNIMLHQMIKQMGGECIYRKTDCAVVINGNPVIEMEKDENDITKTWGSFRNISNDEWKHFKFDRKMSQSRSINYININRPWNTYPHNSSSDWEGIIDIALQKGGLLIEGRAGTGKSFIPLTAINKGKIADDKECRLAFTNKAAQNLNGTTIHKALAINSNEKSNTKSLEKYKNKKVVIVDEIGMINKKLWKHLCILKKKHPDLIFILIGDYRQCKPIENFDFNYFDSSIVKYLVNSNRIELTKKQRYDSELWDFLENYFEYGIIGDLQHTNIIDPNKKMICYFNKTRDEVNDYCMNKCKTTGSMYLPYERLNDDDKAKSAYIYKGLPVMAIKNNCKYDIINTDEFVVDSYTDNFIILKADDRDDLAIEINDFHKNFVVNYISTTHKLQGATITQDLLIFDWYGRPYFNNSLKDDKHVGYTALSRVKSLKQIYIYNV